MKPLKNPFLIAFIAVFTIIGTIIFAHIVIYTFKNYSFSDVLCRRRIRDFICLSAFVSYFIPSTYFIRLSQVISHRNRRLENLEEKKMQAVSAGIYDANS
ncbi:MAG: hypothetical protein K2G60_05565 [Oscillospiraceae bacterium]|nr:hypothetical protein [Oscillospiraceae bacterium]